MLNQRCHTGRGESSSSVPLWIRAALLCNPRERQQEAGRLKFCTQLLSGSMAISHRPEEDHTGQKCTHRPLPSAITGLTESTLEEKKGNHFSSAVRFTTSDLIYPLPNWDRLKKLESDETMLHSCPPFENPSTACHVLVRPWALSLQYSRGPVKSGHRLGHLPGADLSPLTT